MGWLKYSICLLTAFTFLQSCENKRSDIMAIKMPKVMPNQEGKEVMMLYSDSAKLKVTIKAKKMLAFEKNVSEPFTVMPEGVLVSFYDEEEKLESTLRSNYAIHYERSKRMEAKYDVEVVNKNGEKLNTEHLVWDENTKKITSDVFVKITRAREIIMGKGLESNQDFTNYKIKEVTGTIQLNNETL
ncbi:MAG: LPS export ABC transporter periplasmic protein LptC [Bacteroidia bacterium]